MADFKITKIIEKKRNGEKLADEDIGYFIDCVVKSAKSDAKIMDDCTIDPSQIGAMLMAMYLKGLDRNETRKLTEMMTNSGFVFSWPEHWDVVDKHSTGGVGDKISLVLVPALAAVGLKVPMISGRSLSHTGGTLDKLESIPGFRVSLTKEEIYETVRSVGCCIVGQSEDLAPADKILYQCREITATVNSPPMIVASIVSKKLCEGIKALVYDVKYGKGSVFASKEEAEETAKNLVTFSKGVKTSALLTSMENPLGRTIGNSLEVLEAIDVLRGNGPPDVIQLTCALGAELLELVKGETRKEGIFLIREALRYGEALEKFKNMIIHQGVAEDIAKVLCYGNADLVFPKTQHQTDFLYDGEDGYIQEINPLSLAMVWKEELAYSNKHTGVGLKLLKTAGDSIRKGEAWVRIYHQREKLTDEMQGLLRNAISVGKSQTEIHLIDKRLTSPPHSSVLVKEKYHF